MEIRMIIADDNSFIREGMKIILQSYEEIKVLTTVENGREAVDYCLKYDVDIALLDIQMPYLNGVEAVKQIVAQTKTKPLILTTFDDDHYILEAIQNGAKGYLLKNAEPERIREAIRSVYQGNSILEESIFNKLKSNLSGQHSSNSGFDPELFTARELSVIDLVAKGYSNRKISQELYISEGTVANYITTILSKTGLEHRTQIAIYYLTGRINS
ncbi:response regulator transcription factor [Seinonella peptonophila]|nr:response regulator transcription factor [Seinonella peptonophila]